jgi:hypothetical protein
LIEQLNAGRLDVVFAKRPLGTSKGCLVWREPLVWAAADTFDLVPGAALPLALYRERSVSREAALAALNDNELTRDRLYQPQFDRRARGGARGPRHHPASCQRADRGMWIRTTRRARLRPNRPLSPRA